MNIWIKQLQHTLVNLILSLLFFTCWMKGHEAVAIAIISVMVGYFVNNILIIKSTFNPKDVVIITGCDSGLGYSLALHCQSLGAQVIASVHDELSSGAKKLSNSKIVVLPLDVTVDKSINIFVESVTRIINKNDLVLRAVVNNAGVMVFGEFEWQTERQISDQINVNLVGTMNITSKLLPLIRSYHSRLIFVSSHCALESLPGVAVYGATKAGIQAFATSLRVELAKYGVQVVNFIPGSFVTESNIMARQKAHFQKMRESMSDEAKQFYGDYFNRYESWLSAISKENKPAKITNEDIFNIFEGCILDKYPKSVYICEPWRYKFYHTLCKFVPIPIRDYLIQKFVFVPKWKE